MGRKEGESIHTEEWKKVAREGRKGRTERKKIERGGRKAETCSSREREKNGEVWDV